MTIWKPLALFWCFLLQNLSIQISYHKLEDAQIVCKQLKDQSSRIQAITIDHENHELHLILNDYLYIYEIDDAITEDVNVDKNLKFTLNLDKPLEKLLWHEHDRYRLPNQQGPVDRSLLIYNIFDSIHHYLFADGTMEYVKNVQNFPKGIFRVITDGRAFQSDGYLIHKSICTSEETPKWCIRWNNLDFQDFDKTPHADKITLKTRPGYYFRAYITPVEAYELMHKDQPLLKDIPMGFIYQKTVHVLYPPDQKVFIFFYERLAPNMKTMGTKTHPFTVISFDDYLNCSAENNQTQTPTSATTVQSLKIWQKKEIILITLAIIAIILVTCAVLITFCFKYRRNSRTISATFKSRDKKHRLKKKKRCIKHGSSSSETISSRQDRTNSSSKSYKSTKTMTETQKNDSKTGPGKHLSGQEHNRQKHHHHHNHHGDQKTKNLVWLTKIKSVKVLSRLAVPPSIYSSNFDLKIDGKNQNLKISKKLAKIKNQTEEFI